MKTYNKLVRDKIPDLLKSQGYRLKGQNLDEEQYTFELYSLFWQSFKQTLNSSKWKAQIYFADMLEIVRTLMIKNKLNPRKVKADENQAIKWYKNLLPYNQKLYNARTDFLKRFYELLQSNTESIKDQLSDMFNSLKQLVESSDFNFKKIEEVRRKTFEKYGGFSNPYRLDKVSQVRKHSI